MSLKLLGQDAGRLPCIDRYELIAQIASGGMASVYLARLVGVGGFERFFAIKRLHPHLGNAQDFVRMFLDEARIVAGIRHQHVVPVLEVGASEHGYYLVMEYIEGDTLGTFISEGINGTNPLPIKVTVRILIDTLMGLHAAHEHVDPSGNLIGLVHRDVSPQNILVDNNGVARIADFGVAHATSRLGSTRAGQLKGKVAYMAPEQARGQKVTPRSDVFAAGIVLWEALCHRRLFLADNEAVTLNNLIFESIPTLRQVNPNLPVAFEQVLNRALQRDADQRFATAAEMADALRDAARAHGLLGTPADVRTYVRGVIGPALERRRAMVRDHLAKLVGNPSQPPPFLEKPDIGLVKPSDSSVSSAAMAVPSIASRPSSPAEITAPALDSTPPALSQRNLAVFVVVGVGIGALALVGAFFALGGGTASTGGVSAGPNSGLLAEPTATDVATDVASLSADPVPTASVSALSSAPDNPLVTPSGTVTKNNPRANVPPKGTSRTTATTNATRNTPPPTVTPPATGDLEANPYR